MKPYYSEAGITIYHGDCRDVLPGLPDASIDSIVTDPPYELGFMGKKWDRSGIAYQVEVWRECLRALKPGGHLLAFGGSRTYHRLACAIEDAGFEIRDQIQWIYGSGFPKSLDVSKAIDKHQRRDYVFAAINLGLEVPGNSLHDWTKAEHAPSDEWWEKFKTYLNEDQWQAIERHVIGKKAKGTSSIFGNGKGDALISEPATESSQAWNGWGTALKPAHEPIVLARKPLEGTVAENVLKHATGGLNIDGCRIETTETIAPFGSPKQSVGGLLNTTDIGREAFQQNALGRWPANVIRDGSDEVLAGFPETASGDKKQGTPYNHTNCNTMGDATGTVTRDYPGDSGSAARFFYCAKASKEDREEGLGNFAIRSAGEVTDRKDGSDGLNSPRAGAGRTNGSRNHHPTVKPTDLMRYLVRLITPPGGTVLDPFGGSGSMAKAAALEHCNAILIERELEYCELAAARARLRQPNLNFATA